MRLSPGGGRGDATGHSPPPGPAMFLALVVLVCPTTGLGAIGLSTLNTGEIVLDHLVLLLNAAAVDVLGDFLQICHLLIVMAKHACPQATLGVADLATYLTGETLLLLLLQMAAGYVLDNFGPILPYLLSFYLHIIILLNLFGHPV